MSVNLPPVPQPPALVLAMAAYGQTLTAPDAEAPLPAAEDPRASGLAAAAAWSDAITAHRAPQLPDPGATESLIVLLDRPGLAWSAPADRAAADADIRATQDALEPAIAGLGGAVTARWRVTLAGLAVSVPAGRADAVATLPGVRAVAVYDPYTAERAVASNNAQVITFGAKITGTSVAEKLIDIWLESEFQGGRSAPKVAKIDSLDEKYRGQH